MAKLSFTKEEIEELLWITSQYKNTHENHYINNEKEVVENILKELNKFARRLV